MKEPNPWLIVGAGVLIGLLVSGAAAALGAALAGVVLGL